MSQGNFDEISILLVKWTQYEKNTLWHEPWRPLLSKTFEFSSLYLLICQWLVTTRVFLSFLSIFFLPQCYLAHDLTMQNQDLSRFFEKNEKFWILKTQNVKNFRPHWAPECKLLTTGIFFYDKSVILSAHIIFFWSPGHFAFMIDPP